MNALLTLELTKASEKPNKTSVGKYIPVPLYTYVVVIEPTQLIINSQFQEYSYFTFTVSAIVLAGQAISTVTSTRECSRGIVARL